MKKWFHLLALAAVIAACSASSSSSSSGSAPAPDGGTEAGVDAGPPSPAGTCTPNPGSTGNSKHVGAYCSPGGGECSQYGALCAIDVDTEGGKFCIKVGCTADQDCGEMACCTGKPGGPIKGCVPVGCLADAGTCPADVTDAGGGDAADQ